MAMPEQEQPTEEALVFALSQDELYVALRYMEAPAPMELEDFESRVFEDIPKSGRVAFLQAAERALLARQYLVPNQERKLQMHPSVAQVLAVCARPELSWIVLHRAREQAEGAYYFHLREGLFVSHAIPLEKIHEFTVFPDSQPIQQLLVELVAPVGAKAFSYPPGVISQETFKTISEPSGVDGRDQIAQELARVGLPTQTADHFARSLESSGSVTVLTRIVHPDQGEPVPDSGMTIVFGDETLWFIEPHGADDLALRCADPMELPEALDRLMTA